MLIFTKEESSTIEDWAKEQPVHANKKPGITMLVSNKAKFRPKAVEQDREGHCKTIIVRRQLLTSQPARMKTGATAMPFYIPTNGMDRNG